MSKAKRTTAGLVAPELLEMLKYGGEAQAAAALQAACVRSDAAIEAMKAPEEEETDVE